jgi:hypothetical protein
VGVLAIVTYTNQTPVRGTYEALITRHSVEPGDKRISLQKAATASQHICDEPATSGMGHINIHVMTIGKRKINAVQAAFLAGIDCETDHALWGGPPVTLWVVQDSLADLPEEGHIYAAQPFQF